MPDYNENPFKDHLNVYLQDIGKYKVLSKDETYDLIRRYQENGDQEAFDKLLKHNLRFVVTVAKQAKYKHRSIELADLISEGNIGLMRAIEKFDTSRGYSFGTYAIWWIRDAIKHTFEKYNMDMLEREDGENRYLDIFHEGERINNDFEEKISRLDAQKDSVGELLKCLQERERKVIMLFYGLNGGKEMTLNEIGNTTNLTTERVRQIKDNALMKLKSFMLSLPQADFEELKSLR